VRNGRCIAIDLLATPPFDEATARARLQDALGAVRIIR
jgi:hypothetical protein